MKKLSKVVSVELTEEECLILFKAEKLLEEINKTIEIDESTEEIRKEFKNNNKIYHLYRVKDSISNAIKPFVEACDQLDIHVELQGAGVIDGDRNFIKKDTD